MELKDLKSAKDGREARAGKPAQALQKSLKALSVSTVDASSKTAAVEFEVKEPRQNGSGSSVRAKTNEAINVVNVASEATAEIEKLVDSIGGIVDQANNPKVNDSRRQVLEAEANQLVDEIRRKANVKTAQGVRPLAGDSFSLQVEEKFAKTLDIILPDTAKNAFGIGSINFSPKDAILQTRNMIARAREEVEKLKSAVDHSRDQVKGTVDSVEVALQNSEASEVSIRDVDQALKLAGDTKIGIARDPGVALESVGNLQKKALDLLDQ